MKSAEIFVILFFCFFSCESNKMQFPKVKTIAVCSFREEGRDASSIIVLPIKKNVIGSSLLLDSLVANRVLSFDRQHVTSPSYF